MPLSTTIDSSAVAHNKGNGAGGGSTYIMGGQGTSTYNSINVHSINASLGNIDTLKTRSLSANEASILYLQTKEGNIQKLTGDMLQFNTGYVGTLASDKISTKKLDAEDIEAMNAFINTLQSKEITTEYLTVTKQAHFFELVIDKIRSVGGQLILTPASCIIDYVYGVNSQGNWVKPTQQNYNSLVAFDVFWRSTEDTGRSITNDFIRNDQVICQSFSNAHVGTNYDISNKYYWRLVESVQDDVWINLTTGAIAPSQEYATNNKYRIVMNKTVTKNNDNDSYYENGIEWDVEAQQIIGYQTNVSWTDETLGYDQAVNGIFETASQVYGIQITPAASNQILGITSRLDFHIEQIVDNSYIIPNRINVGVYFQDSTFKVFNEIALDPVSGNITLDLGNPESPIEAITIVSTADVDWHQCHTMRISNVDCDRMLDGYSSIPSAGDNLVQLGYRGNDDADRQSAIIISAYKSPDPGVHAPSYAAYMGINDYDLASHRGSYIDARGAKFVGDITMCSVGDQSIGDAIDDIEKKNKKLLVDTANIEVWPIEGSISQQVYTIDPHNINVTILAPGENGMNTLNYVPEGYVVDFNFFSGDQYNSASQYDFYKVQNDLLTNLTMPTGQYVGDIRRLRIRLIKDEFGVPPQNAIVVDYVDIPYIQGVTPAVDGGKWEFRYCNHTPTEQDPLPVKPTEGSNGIGSFTSDGVTSVWDSEGHTPDVEHGEFTFMSQCYCTAANQYGEWTNPFRITGGNGKDGEDGTDIEYIYTRRHEVWDNPVAPASPPRQDDWYGYDANTGQDWTDNPQGVDSYYMYEYISMRTKESGQDWGNYSVPVIWSKWGEKGQDGDGFEYIFRLTDSTTPPDNPTPNDWDSINSNYQTQDEYAPYLAPDWSDDPVSVSQNNRYLYVSKRIRNYDSAYNRVLWHPFSAPALWARYAEQGETGGHYEFRYCNYTPVTGHLLPDKPTTGSDGTTGGWSRTPSNPDVNNGEYTYMSQCYLTPGSPHDTYGEWTTPVRITGGNGEDGADGTDIEFIYTQKSDIWASAMAPSIADDPTIAQDDWPNIDGHTPEKTINGTTWYDNPRGVTNSMKYEYMCVRYKPGGSNTWGEYSTPVIWSAYGDKGMDGDGFEYIYKLTPTSNVSDAGDPTPSDYRTNTTYQNSNEYCQYINNPSGQEPWTDDPSGVSENKKYEWVSVRTRTNGVWGPYSTPAIWARWAMPGQSGGHYEFRYCNFVPTIGHTTPTKPTAGSNGLGTYGTYQDAATWAYTVADPNINMGEYTYMTHCYVDGDNTYGTWEDPVRITGADGKPGADGQSVEFIYRRFKTAQTWTSNDLNPANWPANQTADYTGKSYTSSDSDAPNNKWTDNPNGVTDTYLFEYISTRTNENGTWTKFTTPVIWSKYGEKGMDGDGYEYIYKLYDTAPTDTLTPSNWETNSNYQNNDEYAPFLSGWSDDPLTPTAQTNKTVCWVAVRKKSNGVWQPFSSPSMWSMYVTAEGGQPGAPGANAQYNYLIPNREILMAKIIDAYANNGNCDLYCDLDYSLVHVDGDTVTTLDWTGYSLYIEAFNDSTPPNNSIWHTTNSDGVYKQNNLMATINNVAAQRDYMKCYEDYRNRCPIYLEVSLKKNNTVLDKRCIPVQLENGAVLKVQKDGIRSIVGDTGGSTMVGWVQNNYSTKDQTAGEITSEVSKQMTNYYDKNTIDSTLSNYSTIKQTADAITMTVSKKLTDYYTKDQTYSKSEIEQTAEKVALGVYSSGGGVSEDDLKRTGIDITAGTIELTAENTVINGNLNVRESDTGLVVYDDDGRAAVTLLNRSIGNDPQGISQVSTPSWRQTFTGTPQSASITCDFGLFGAYADVYFSDGWYEIWALDEKGNIIYDVAPNPKWEANSQRYGWEAAGSNLADFNRKNNKNISLLSYDTHIIETFNFNFNWPNNSGGRCSAIMITIKFRVETFDNFGIKIGIDGAQFQTASNKYNYLGASQTCLRHGNAILRIKDGKLQRNDGIFQANGRTNVEMGTIFGDISGVVSVKQDGSGVTNDDTFIVMTGNQTTCYLPKPNASPTGKIYYVKNLSNRDECYVYGNNFGNYTMIPANGKTAQDYISIGRNSCMFINTGSYWVQFYCG